MELEFEARLEPWPRFLRIHYANSQGGQGTWMRGRDSPQNLSAPSLHSRPNPEDDIYVSKARSADKMQDQLRVNSLLSQILSHQETQTMRVLVAHGQALAKRGEISQISTTSQDNSGNEWHPSLTVTHGCWSVAEGQYRASPLFTKHPASVQRFPTIVLCLDSETFPCLAFNSMTHL